MNKEQMIKWIKALRSGDYIQHRGSLADSIENPTAFCCLGLNAHINGINLDEESNGYKFNHDCLDKFDKLDIISTNTISRLWYMNDGIDTGKHTFPEIADWIETNLLPYASDT